jgi:hypothetical protein
LLSLRLRTSLVSRARFPGEKSINALTCWDDGGSIDI